MEQLRIRKILQVGGMSCTNCEIRIENAVSTIEGVIAVKAIYSSSNVYVTYDANVVTLNKIIKAIEELDYEVKNKPESSLPDGQSDGIAEKHCDDNRKTAEGKSQIGQMLGIGIIVAAIFIIVKNTIGFNFIPEINQSMGYGILFVIGLITSLHCIAMCGGINLSQCVAYRFQDSDDSRVSRLKPSLMYNAGRVLSYTVIGGIVGGLGSVISFSGYAKGIVAVLSGVFMVVMGLNMLNIFPWLRRINPRMPKLFGKKVYNSGGKHGPFYIGLLNGLMPCGPLQAMQLYALGTGSVLAGALSMLVFSLGTVPLMFGFGAVSTLLGKKFTGKMMKVSAVLVMFLGIIMLSRGLALSGVNIVYASSGSTGNVAKVQGQVQEITTTLESGRYAPIVVQKGIPVKWTIKAASGDLNGCNNRLMIPQYNIRNMRLVPGDNVIEFTPDENGSFIYTCWMGMIRSSITVVDNVDTVNPADLQQTYPANGGSAGGMGCCAQ